MGQTIDTMNNKNGVDLDYRVKEGITPLLWTLYAGNKKGFEELLKLGASPDVKEQFEARKKVIEFLAEREIKVPERKKKYRADGIRIYDVPKKVK